MLVIRKEVERMQDKNDYYCERCSYDFEKDEEVKEESELLPEGLKDFVFRLTGFVL